MLFKNSLPMLLLRSTFRGERQENMTTTEANERLAADIKLLARDAEELLRATAGEAGEKIKEVRERLYKAVESAKTTCENLQDKTAETAKAADEAIREHPYESIAIAFGVGALIGLFVGRR
jgi:ElaB/YqjD/DUF883 family membrane-anchored ribosome-binding protein